MKPVQSVTTTPASAADDQGLRMRRYFMAMGTRLACGVLAYFADGWLRWTLVGAALVLPYVAVVLANAAGPRSASEIERVDTQPEAVDSRAAPFADGSTIQSSVVDDEPRYGIRLQDAVRDEPPRDAA